MPSFTVTSAGERIHLDATGAGQAQYTVTNTSAASLDGRLLAVPQDPAKTEWFSIDGEAARPFAPGAAERAVVEVRVPAGTPPATYSFRLDAVSEAAPDEDFTEGPTVSFDVALPAPPVPWWKRYWWIIVIAAVVLLAIVGVVLWLVLRGSGGTTTTTATVPSVVGQHEDVATSQLSGVGFHVSPARVSTRDPAAVDVVSAQDPTGGAVANVGSTVTISVGQLATATVPNVVRQPATRAVAVLERLGFTVRAATIFTPNTALVGLVLKQSPAGGAVEPIGTAVILGVGENRIGAFRPTTTTAAHCCTSTVQWEAPCPASP